MFIVRVGGALDKAGIPYALVGGYAVALHGAVRGTLDVDIVIRHRRRDFLKAEAALNALGLQSRLPVKAAEVFDFRDEFIRNRSMTAWTFVNAARPSEIVDIILTQDLTGMRTRRIKVLEGTLRVASIADLIRMKQASRRAQDLEDIKALERLR